MTAQRGKLALMTFVAVAGTLLIVSAAHAAAGSLQAPAQEYQGLLDLIQSNANQWAAALRGYATRLFWSLAVIQLAWTFFPLAIRQADIGEIVGELLRVVLVIGFFYALLLYSTQWATDVVESFRQAGAAAAHTGTALQPGDIFYLAVDLAKTVRDGTPAGIMHIPDAVAGALAAAIILLAFAFVAAFMTVTLVESYLVINASVLFMGFGGSQWTREFAIAMARYAVAVGAKLFVLTLLVGLIIQSAHQWEAAYTNDESSMWTLVGLALVCAYLAKQIPDLVQGLITGTSLGGGAAIGSMATAGAVGATAALAAMTTGSAGSAGLGVPNGGGGGGGVGPGSGGLESVIGSTMMGGAPAGLGGSMSGARRDPIADSLRPRTGGWGNAGRNQASASGSSQQTPRSSAAGAPWSAGSGAGRGGEGATASTSPEMAAGGAESDAAPGGASGEGAQPGPVGATPSSASRGLAADRALHSAVDGAVRTAGVLAALSVPGMESAAGLTIGPHPGGPPQNGAGDAAGWGRSELASPEPENTIRPASDPASPKPTDDGGQA
jgi:type IV secretion system protein TrbL